MTGKLSSRDNDGGFEIFNDPDATPAPDPEIRRIEDTISSSIASAKTRDLFPLRPGYGALGQPNILQTNFLAIHLPQQDLFCYEIHIRSPFSSEALKPATVQRLIYGLLKSQFSREQTRMATDFQSTLVSCVEIPSTRAYRHEDSDAARGTNTHSSRAVGAYEIYFRLSCKLSSELITKFLQRAEYHTTLKTWSEMLHALETILSYSLNQKALELNTAKNPPLPMQSGSRSCRSGSSSDMVRYFYIKAHHTTARILLSVRIGQGSDRQAQPFSALISNYLSRSPTRLDRLEELLKGVRVSVRISSSNKRRTAIRIIQGLATCNDGARLRHPPRVSHFGAGPRDIEIFKKSPYASLAQMRSGRGYISLTAYFERGKLLAAAVRKSRIGRINNLDCGIRLNPDLPVINVGTTDQPLYIPVELCEAEPGQLLAWLSAYEPQRQRRPSGTVIKDIISDTTLAGWYGSWNSQLAGLKILVSPNPVSIISRVLAAPRVLYARRAPARTVQGVWKLCKCRVVEPATLRPWSWIHLDLSSDDVVEVKSPTFKQSLSRLNRRLRRMGISTYTFARGKTLQLNKMTTQVQIEQAVSFLLAKQHPSMILVIVSPGAQKFVPHIRLVCDIIHGIPSIEVMEDWLTRNDQELYGKIGLRMNLKLGGRNHSVDPTDLGFFANGTTMIMGVNIESVPATTAGKPPLSIIGFTASLNRHLAQWPAEVSVQRESTRIIYSLNSMLESRLHSWSEEHDGRMPEDIVIFRNVMSDGDEGLWIEQEVHMFQDTCRRMALTAGRHCPSPRIAVVLVDEHHDARCFSTADIEGYKFGHPPAGTVIDRGISQAGCWDFVLQPLGFMSTENGQIRYCVVFDEVLRRHTSSQYGCSATADLLQDLIHKLCYLPGETTRAHKVCSPIHYARQACARARSYLHLINRPPLSSDLDKSVESSLVELHPRLRNTMFYL